MSNVKVMKKTTKLLLTWKSWCKVYSMYTDIFHKLPMFKSNQENATVRPVAMSLSILWTQTKRVGENKLCFPSSWGISSWCIPSSAKWPKEEFYSILRGNKGQQLKQENWLRQLQSDAKISSWILKPFDVFFSYWLLLTNLKFLEMQIQSKKKVQKMYGAVSKL